MSRSSPSPRRSARLTAIVFVALVSLLAAACSSGSTAGISISGAWARPSQAMAAAGAAYMIIENTGTSADALLSGSSSVAKTVEVHETVEMVAPSESVMPVASGATGSGMESPMASGAGVGAGSGMMGMQKVDRLEIPAGGSVELKPGSYHIMLIDLTQELKVGDTIEITLKFEKAGEIKVQAEVRAS